MMVRALLLADDLALIASSPEDLQALIDAWSACCDKNLLRTQIDKSETVVLELYYCCTELL